MYKKIITNIALLISLFFLSSCSSSNTAGGSDMPNGKLSVALIDSLGNSITSSVTIRSVKLTPTGQVTLFEDNKESDEHGAVVFNNIPKGRYIISATSLDSAFCAIKSQVNINEDSDTLTEFLTLLSPVIFKGRVLSSQSSVKTLIPGVNKIVDVNNDGFYCLNNVPVGEFELAFISDTLLSVTSIQTKNSSTDTIFVRDLAHKLDTNNLLNNFNYYESSFENSSYISPEIYEFDNAPQWYSEKDFSQITYFKLDSLDTPQIPIWHFPVIAGVTSKTVSYYGGLLAVTDSIKKQIKKVDSLFNIEGLTGDIEITLDSVYEITQHPDSENVEPPDGFAVRVLYDGYAEGTTGNWIRNKRVIVHNILAEGTGVFSDNALGDLLWEFGLFRGCSYISGTNIYPSKNSVNGVGFSPPSTVMNLRSTTDWLDANIYIMNYSAGEYSILPPITLTAFADTIGVEVVNQFGDAVEGVKINVYGAEPFSDSLDNIADFTGVSNRFGRYTFNENPFVTADKKNHVFDNLLIEVDDGDNKYYSFLPLYLMYEWWFEHPNESYFFKVIVL